MDFISIDPAGKPSCIQPHDSRIRSAGTCNMHSARKPESEPELDAVFTRHDILQVIAAAAADACLLRATRAMAASSVALSDGVGSTPRTSTRPATACNGRTSNATTAPPLRGTATRSSSPPLR